MKICMTAQEIRNKLIFLSRYQGNGALHILVTND